MRSRAELPAERKAAKFPQLIERVSRSKNLNRPRSMVARAQGRPKGKSTRWPSYIISNDLSTAYAQRMFCYCYRDARNTILLMDVTSVTIERGERQ